MHGPQLLSERFVRVGLLLGLGALILTCAWARPVRAAGHLYIGKPAKYVFLFIGDGMGAPQRTAAELFLTAQECGKGDVDALRPEKLAMNSLPAHGMTTTYAYNAIITDSAASGTALACGRKTVSGVVAMDHTKRRSFKTIAEIAKERGMRVGIVSSVSIDHATPACFYAHQAARGDYWEICMQLARSGFDYFGGGGMKGDLSSKRKGRPSPLDEVREQGYRIVTTPDELQRLGPDAGKVFAYNHILDADQALYYEIDRNDEHISLQEFTAKGIELLDNPRGFFFMVEGGKIDWACHANDAASAIRDTLAFDAAIREALDFYMQRPSETLIVVTGDHECGGMTIGFAGTKYKQFPEKLAAQQMSYIEFNRRLQPLKDKNASFGEVWPVIRECFGLGGLTSFQREQLEQAWQRSVAGKEERAADDSTYLLYGGYEPLTVKCTHVLNQQAGIGWTSYSHTGVPVPTSATGVGADTFNGYYDNTMIFHKTLAVMTGGQVAGTRAGATAEEGVPATR